MNKELFNNFNHIFNNFKNTIGYLVFKKIFLGYLFIILSISIYQSFIELREAEKTIEKNVITIERLFVDELRVAAMNNDKNKINKILNIISKEKIISGIHLMNKEIELYFPVDKRFYSKERYQSHKFIIYDNPYFKNNYVADVEFFTEKNIADTQALNQIYRIVLYFLIFTPIFWILVVYFTNKYLTIPLKKLIDGIKAFEEHEEVKSEIELTDLRELSILAQSFNKMSGKISEDIINLRQLTMIQNSQKKALEEANRAKDDFLANMSHELKTPLNSINLISSIMMKNKSNKFDEKEVKNLEIINSCGNDLLFLINDVLDISKLEAGKLELYNETINFKKLMYEIKDMFEPQVLEKNLDFVFEYDKSIELIYSDKQRIKQVIKNLLSNSLKFVHEGAIRFLVSDEEDLIKIVISDDGIGIEKDKLDTIFDRFKQVDGSTTRKYGGTGLGLAICKDLVTLFNGDIKMESEVNKGTTVTVKIPKNLDKVDKDNLEKEEEVVLEVKKSKKQTNEMDNIFFGSEEKGNEKVKQNIAVLHKDPISFMGLIIDLNKDYVVTQCLEIKEFISKIKNNSYDLFIIDRDFITQEQLDNHFMSYKEKLILVTKEEIPEVEGVEIIKKPFDKAKTIETISKKINS